MQASDDLQGMRLKTSLMALVTIDAVLVTASLSTGLLPLLVDGFVRVGGLSPQAAGLCITAEMLGQAVGAALVFFLTRRVDSRYLLAATLLLILAGNAITIAPLSFPFLLTARAIAGIGGGMSGVCMGLLAQTGGAERNIASVNAVTIIICGILGANAPTLYHLIGATGIFAALAGIALLCTLLLPFVPRARPETTQNTVGKSSPSKIILTALLSLSFFAAVIMFWSYAGQIGASHGMSVDVVSTAVSIGWLVGGLCGSAAVILLANRVPHIASVIISACGLSIVTWAALYVTSPTGLAIALAGLVFFWLFMYPVQMGILSQVDPSGRLSILAFFFQLLASALGPAIGGEVLQVSSYTVMVWLCQIAYLAFVFTALPLVHIGTRRSFATEAETIAC
ncbi:MAG: hypothetical protein JWR80_6653 [Bradyrhizobium sp.]|nr:hypothetical protein [Bradyrhizobium sp.]